MALCLSYLLPLWLQWLDYPSSLKRNSNRCTGLHLSSATEVALLLNRPNFNTGKTYNYKGLPFVN